jgi:DNA modification methylase
VKIEPNNIYLGDSYELIKFIKDKSVDCIYTDIPYLFDSHGKGTSELAERMDKKNKDFWQRIFPAGHGRKSNQQVDYSLGQHKLPMTAT